MVVIVAMSPKLVEHMDVVDRHLKTEDKGLEDYFLGFQWVE